VDKLREIRDFLSEVLGFPLMHFGGVEVTLGLIVYIALLFWLLVFFTGRIKRWFLRRFLKGSDADIGVRQAVATIIRYCIVVLGSFIILQTAGIDLSALLLVAGGLGIGIGFGLQNAISNFTSGLIILFERPIKIGDRIDVGGVTGDVTNISLRATTIRTNDNIFILVPNSEFTDSRVTNWTYSDRDVRIWVPVGVSYSSDAEEVKKLLFEVAAEEPGVLKEPPPEVLFSEYAESSLNFNLLVWTREFITRPPVLRSRLNFAIQKKFREHGIQIPFPQRDLHIKSGTLSVKSE
jgi:small-conductance mechanosensitive channel